MSRIFKITNDETMESAIEVISETDISTRYNVYGFYKERTDIITIEDIEQVGSRYIFDINESYDVDREQLDVLETMIKGYDGGDLLKVDSCEKATQVLYILNKIKIEDEEDCYATDGDEIYYLDESNCQYELEQITDLPKEEYETDWDGNNWKTTVLTSDTDELGVDFIEEITDELGVDFEDKLECLHSTSDSNGYSSDYYIHTETNKMYEYHMSRWQGSGRDYYTEMSERDIELILSQYVSDEEILKYFPKFAKKHGTDLRCAFEQTMSSYDAELEYEIFSRDDVESIATRSSDNIGSELFKHKLTNQHYILHWSNWQGDHDSWNVVSNEEVDEYLSK